MTPPVAGAPVEGPAHATSWKDACEASLQAFGMYEEAAGHWGRYGADLWDRFLEWCRSSTGAACAFVADQQGFVVGSSGSVEGLDVARAAIHSMLALGRCRAMADHGDPVELLAIRYARHWISAVPLEPEPGQTLTVGVVGPLPADSALRGPRSLSDRSWTDVVGWARGAPRGTAAFALDGRGQTVALQGRIDDGQAQVLGNHLLLVLEQAAEMAPSGRNARWVAVRFARRWLTGFAVRVSRPRTAVLGVVGRAPLWDLQVAAVRRLVRSKLRRSVVAASTVVPAIEDLPLPSLDDADLELATLDTVEDDGASGEREEGRDAGP